MNRFARFFLSLGFAAVLMVEVLIEGRADAVLAASIFHFGQHTVGEVKEHLRGRGICVR